MLLMRAGEAGAGAGGQAARAALGAFVGLVTGNGHFDDGARGDVEFEASAAAIDQCAGGNGEAAFLLDDANCFARGAAGSPNILDDEDTLARFQLEAATQRHLAGTVAFDEKSANAERTRDFVADDYAAERGRDNTCNRMIVENIAERFAERFGVLRELENERALDVGGAVASAGEFEMALADGAYLFEEL